MTHEDGATAESRATDGFTLSRAWASLVLALVVFLACLFGIGTRPVGFLASLWPANAIMLGLLIRLPRAAGPLGWIGAGAAFMAADLLTGAAPLKALMLNGANMIGVALAYFAYLRLPQGVMQMQQPTSMPYLVLIAAIGAAGAAAAGAIANPLLFNRSLFSGWTMWFATELVNYIAILPVMLAFPIPWTWRSDIWMKPENWRLRTILPAAALLVSCIAALLIGGPGAIAFPVPALLWCGLIYPVFPTAVLTLLFGVWILVVLASGYLPSVTGSGDETALISVRLGVSLIALAPILLSGVMQSRDALLLRLRHLATHDQLTGADNRAAFRDGAEQLLARVERPIAVLMIDLDHFKAINDSFGHAGGDQVLVGFAQRVRQCLRGNDLFGRLGGEEFAVVIPDCPLPEVVRIAERIRASVASAPIALDDGRSAKITTSIGLVAVVNTKADLDTLLAEADSALYMAKERGRDRVEIARKAA